MWLRSWRMWARALSLFFLGGGIKGYGVEGVEGVEGVVLLEWWAVAVVEVGFRVAWWEGPEVADGWLGIVGVGMKWVGDGGLERWQWDRFRSEDGE